MLWLAIGTVLHGWARSVAGDTAEGLSRINNGLRDYRATGAMLNMPFWLALRAEALHLAGCTREALESIDEAETLVERSEERWCCAELHRLRGLFQRPLVLTSRKLRLGSAQPSASAKTTEVGFTRKTRRSNLRRILPPKRERVGRARIAITADLTHKLCETLGSR